MLPYLYHAHHNRHLEDLPFWLGLGEQTADPILELGCGTGRVLIPLAEAGHRTIGLDYNLSMLELLKTNLTPQIKTKPLLVAADITRFHLAARFPLIIFPCNTFSTFDDSHRKDCLECVHHQLTQDGIFAVSLPNPEILKLLPVQSLPEVEEEFYHPRTGNPVQVSSSWKHAKRTFNVTWAYDHLFPDGTVEHQLIETRHQLASLEIYVGDFEKAGLKVSEIYGDYDRSAYHTESPQLIILATHCAY